jgi:DNA replication protein DnaC
MAFYRPDYVRVKNAFTSKKEEAKAASEERRAALSAEIPELDSICRQLSATGPRIFEAALHPEGDLEGKIAAIRKENEALLAEQKRILAEHGYPEDWFDVKYECPICNDEGNVDGVMCVCMKKQLIEAGYETAGIAGLAATHNFETFDLSYYDYDSEIRSKMKYVFERVKNYAETFKVGASPSLLFLGGTGLGKTHLSVAAAKRVIELQNYVVYGTAQNIFADFEHEKFNKPYTDQSPSRTDKYYECDLLVMDDLGTELKSQAVTAFLYNLLNTRLGEGKPMIISTNLTTADAIVERYDERIGSRLLGEFLPYKFAGKDVRMLKLKKR